MFAECWAPSAAGCLLLRAVAPVCESRGQYPGKTRPAARSRKGFDGPVRKIFATSQRNRKESDREMPSFEEVSQICLGRRTNVCTRRKRTCGPQGGSPGSDPIIEIGRSLNRTAANKKYRLVCRQPKPNQVILILHGARPAPPRRLLPQTKRSLWLRKQRRRRRRKGRKKSERRSRALARAAIPPEQFSRRAF
jgi:hypothetical protein